jgi:hypothetical protein
VNSLLAIYLQDHHAAGVAGARLARRVASTVSSDDSTVDLPRVAEEIAEDLSSLESIMRGLGTKPNAMKDAMARAGERLGRLKPNGRLRQRSPLSDVLELETLLVGITGKQALWVSLRRADVLPSEQLDRLALRAEGQKRTVESARETAARRAFESRERPPTGSLPGSRPREAE